MKPKKGILSILMIVFALLRFVDYVYAVTAFQILQAGILIAVLAGVAPRVNTAAKLVLAMMSLIGASLLLYSGVGLQDWLRALLQNGNLAMLLICVPMISMPFYYEDYQAELKKLIQARMHNVMSFLGMVAICSHILSALISVGSIPLIYPLLLPFALMYNAEKFFLKTVSRGYFSTGFWSPAWASVIIYSVYPDVKWLKVIPVGIGFAVLYTAMNLASMYFETRRKPQNFRLAEPEPGPGHDQKKIRIMMLMAAAMIASIIVFNTASGWDLILVVSLVSVGFPLIAALAQGHGSAYRRLIKNYYNVSLPKTMEQVAIFVLAGFLGRALDVSGAGLAVAGLLPEWLRYSSPAMIAAIALIMALPSLVGVHPTATGTAMVAVLQPAALGLANYTYCLALILGWIVGHMVAPFSGTALLISGINGKSNFANSVLLNWKFSLVCIVVFSLLISVIGPMM